MHSIANLSSQVPVSSLWRLGVGDASSQVQGQILDRAGTCPCTDPQEYLMVQGHSSDPKMSRCRATPVDHNGASEPKSEKVDGIFKIFHETGIRSTKNVDFLPFGYSFERRIDLEGSRYGLEGPF